MKRYLSLLFLFSFGFLFSQQFANPGFESVSCPNNCLPANGQMSCVTGWWSDYTTGVVPLQKIGCNPNEVCSGNYSIKLTSSSGSIGSSIRTNNPYYGMQLGNNPAVISLTAKRLPNGTANGVVKVIGRHAGQYNWNELGYAGPSTTGVCQNINIILDPSVTLYEELSFHACVPSGTCHGGLGNNIIVDNICTNGTLFNLSQNCGKVTVAINPALNLNVTEFFIDVTGPNGNYVGSYDSTGQPLVFNATENGTYTIFIIVGHTVNGQTQYIIQELTYTVNSVQTPISIFADGANITSSLVANIPCGESCINLSSTGITNPVYNTTANVLTDLNGLFCLPSGSTLTNFTATITGTNSCGNPVCINVQVNVVNLISNFNIDGYNCHDGVYDVTMSSVDQGPNHGWEIWETSVDGSTSDADVIGMVTSQSSWQLPGLTNVTFTGLDPNKFYFVKHGVWSENCNWRETRKPLKRDCCIDEFVLAPYESGNPGCDQVFAVYDENGNQITNGNGYTVQWCVYTFCVCGTTNWEWVCYEGDTDYISDGGYLQKAIVTTPEGCVYEIYHHCCFQNLTLDIKSVQEECEAYTIELKLDGSSNLGSALITWNDGLYTNQSSRPAVPNTEYTATVKVPKSYYGIEETFYCTYKASLKIDCLVDECENFTAPTNLQVGGIIGTTLMWSAVPGATHYVVSSPGVGPIRNCKCETPISIVPITTTTNSLALPSSLVNKCFVWMVTAYCADGTSATSEQACYSAKGKDEFVTVSPNPSGGRFKINTEELIDGVIEISDLYGVVIYKHEFKNQQEFDIFMEDRPIGIYIVKVYTNDKVHTTKIIKN